MDCVWCARNGSPGFSVLFEERHECDGVIIVDECPPFIIKVSRDGADYLIEGNYLLTFAFDENRFPSPSITVCGEVCMFTSMDWNDKSIKCTVEKSSFFLSARCSTLTIRGKVKASHNAFLAFASRRLLDDFNMSILSGRREILDRYYEHDNGMLTLVHDVVDVTAKYKQIIIVVTAVLLLILGLTITVISYVKIQQYRRRKEWETMTDKLESMREIDRGTFGIVCSAKHDGAWVAVKQLNTVHPGHHKRQFENEIWLLKTLGMRYRHPHLIRLLWVVLKPQVMIITELCHGSLHRQIHDYKRQFAPEAVLAFCDQIASGMNFLHSKSVIHRDLKSGNVLLTDKEGTTLKICDFGLSNIKAPRQTRTNGYFAGSLLWMAPEILAQNIGKEHAPYSFASDVYAFGVCVFELLTSRLPYRGYAESQIVWQVAQGTLKPDYAYVGDGMHFDLLKTVSEWCISYRPGARPSFETISAILSKYSTTTRTSQADGCLPSSQARTCPGWID
ncbi:RAF protein [Aphelenchoides avenae]|nr:RAF protein [Aphelenchus avenae]